MSSCEDLCVVAGAALGSIERTGLPSARIALVSDDEQLRSLLYGLLIAHGYGGVVGIDSRSFFGREEPRAQWDVAIVDVAFPYEEALHALARLKAASVATIAIFAKKNGGAPHAIAACSDVLLGKPFDPRELLLLIRGMLDSDEDAAPLLGSTVTAGPIALSPLFNSASVVTRRIELTDVEKRILHELLLNAARPVTRERLTRRALMRAWSPGDRGLDTHINRLRRKVGPDRRGRTPIRTVTGVGYLLLADWDPAA